MMTSRLFQAIGSRLSLVVAIMLSGFVVVGVTAVQVLNQLELAYEKRGHFHEQALLLRSFHESFLQSVVLVDRVLFENADEIIPDLLALNEDGLASFGQYQSNAESLGLTHDSYQALENEPVIFQLRSDFYRIVSLVRNQRRSEARQLRLNILQNRMVIVSTFIEDASDLRRFDIEDQTSRIAELKRKIYTYSLLIFIAAIFIVIVVTLLVHRSITRPLAAITRAVDHFNPASPDNNLSLDVDQLPNDEVGRLGRSFDNMADQLRQNQAIREKFIAQLEQKNTELERFTYTVSHDLKSPLVTVKGFLGLLERDIKGGDSRQVNEDMRHIVSAADSMGNLLDDLLDLSRIGQVVNQPKHVTLNTLVEDALFLLQVPIEESGAKVEVLADMPSVFVDRRRINEVMQNLLENAIKFSGSGNTPKISVSAELQDNMVLCRIQDNGIGIDPRYQEKIFGLFDRLEVNTEGTGIGLALVKRIIEVHDGKIWVESDGDGQGSVFYFTLPPGNGENR